MEFDDLYSTWQRSTDDGDYSFLETESLSNAIKIVTESLFEDSDRSIIDPSTFTISNAELLCSHKKLNPSNFFFAKAITDKGLEKLKSIGYQIHDKLTVADWCEVCFRDTLDSYIESFAHSQDVEIVKKSRNSKEKFAVSKKWFQEWKKKIPFDGQDIPLPTQEPYRSDIFCKHQNFSTDDSKMTFVSKEVHSIPGDISDLIPLGLQTLSVSISI
jgi:hypothetical protein